MFIGVVFTFTPDDGCPSCLDFKGLTADADWLMGIDLNMLTTGPGEAHNTSFQTAIKYGELVDKGGNLADLGSPKN